GLLVRERRALEAARNIDVVLFDKTGTLTQGQQGVVGVVAENETKLLEVAAAIEQETEHTVARAIVSYATGKNTAKLEAKQFSSLPGRGVRAVIGGKTTHAGGPRLLEELGIELSARLQAATDDASASGKSVIYVIEGERILGAIMLADIIREESKQAVDSLRSMGKRVAMLTGDSKGVAAWVAGELGVDEYFAEVLPE